MGGKSVKNPGEGRRVAAKVNDLMIERVMCATTQQTVGHVKEVMTEHGIHSMPVVDPEEAPVGIVTASDLLRAPNAETRVKDVMTSKVFTVPRYADPALAARIMRNHHIHHVVVTEEKKVAGILSSFDLLKLVEDRRFSMRQAPTKKSGGQGARRRAEEG